MDYAKAPREDLIARIMVSQMYGQFQHKAYDALLSYGVNYRNLRVWKELSDAVKSAGRMKALAAQEFLVNFFTRLENDLAAAVRRKTLTTIVDNT